MAEAIAGYGGAGTSSSDASNNSDGTGWTDATGGTGGAGTSTATGGASGATTGGMTSVGDALGGSGIGGDGGSATNGAGGASNLGQWGSGNGDDGHVTGESYASAAAAINTEAFNQQIVMGANVLGNTVDMNVVGGSFSSSLIGEDS
jgi:hypothetical protein